jgi:hypothetical protein
MVPTMAVCVPGFTETGCENIVSAKNVENPQQAAYCQGRDGLVNTQGVFQGYGKIPQNENNYHYNKHDTSVKLGFGNSKPQR